MLHGGDHASLPDVLFCQRHSFCSSDITSFSVGSVRLQATRLPHLMCYRQPAGGNGDVGLAFLIFLGPVGRIFRGPIVLATVGVLLLLMAGLQSRRVRLGALVGAAWALGVVVLLVIALARISVSYSFAARILMFGPASALNIGLLVALGRRSVFSSSVSDT